LNPACFYSCSNIPAFVVMTAERLKLAQTAKFNYNLRRLVIWSFLFLSLKNPKSTWFDIWTSVYINLLAVWGPFNTKSPIKRQISPNNTKEFNHNSTQCSTSRRTLTALKFQLKTNSKLTFCTKIPWRSNWILLAVGMPRIDEHCTLES